GVEMRGIGKIGMNIGVMIYLEVFLLTENMFRDWFNLWCWGNGWGCGCMRIKVIKGGLRWVGGINGMK
uniref:hypothetical protein n=1 Tax=Bacillus altitudinis TaxID=293387 RepID=UPI001C92F833